VKGGECWRRACGLRGLHSLPRSPTQTHTHHPPTLRLCWFIILPQLHCAPRPLKPTATAGTETRKRELERLGPEGVSEVQRKRVE
jgi:hypothetical protein